MGPTVSYATLIIVRDQLEFAGPGDIAATMEISKLDKPSVHFAIAADVWHAHRLVLHTEHDRGLMACRDGTDPESIWINHVGTFGFAFIAYWWARLIGIAGRFASKLAGDSWLWLLVSLMTSTWSQEAKRNGKSSLESSLR